MPVLRVLQLLPLTFKGRHVGAKEVTMGRLKTLSAVPAAPLPMQADGEVITTGATTVDVEVLPGALNAITPGRH
jgi:diacylglycerol kinase family enzyme